MPQTRSKPRTAPKTSRNGDAPASSRQPFEVRDSGIHGRGGFATRRIPKGRTIIEYRGERISQDEADERYGDDGTEEHVHTFLFTIDDDTVIDPARQGNDARYLNHSCAPNCRSYIERKRIFIEAARDIEPGEELTYDYKLVVDLPRTRKLEERYICRCGAPRCRGTQLAPAPRKRGSRPARAS